MLHLESVRLVNNNRHNKFEKSWKRVLTLLNGEKNNMLCVSVCVSVLRIYIVSIQDVVAIVVRRAVCLPFEIQ